MATKNDIAPERIKQLKQKRRAKKKARKHRKDVTLHNESQQDHEPPFDIQENEAIKSEPLQVDQSILKHFSNVLEHFDVPAETKTLAHKNVNQHNDDDEEEEEEEKSGSVQKNNDEALTVSKKQLRKLTRLTVEELKQLVDIPEVVEPWDVDAMDPKLLISLKSYRNTIPVPGHWCQERPYLQRRKERKPWVLPDFIKQTGISEIRDAIKEKEKARRGGAKRRARLNPKLGKMDLDYQKLHDAFYRFQTKPKNLTGHGDLYYEGKELVNHFKPGEISIRLREALDSITPPPWLFSMQRYGPPPSYPQLVLPGVNAPIPKGAEWGFKPGQWGRPPVDEFNQPLYGNVFGIQKSKKDNDDDEHHQDGVVIDRTLWGELEPEVEDQNDEKEGSSSDQNDSDTASEIHEDDEDEYLTEIQVVPDTIELRKTITTKNDKDDLYQILSPIQSGSSSTADFMPSQKRYRLQTKNGFMDQDVDVTLDDPSDLTQKTRLQTKYDEAQKERRPKNEDLSDMYLDHANRQAKRLEKREQYKISRQKDI